jgi:hypothetical protein
MRTFAIVVLFVTAALAVSIAPVDPFLEGIPFGAVADAVVEAMRDAGYSLTESSDDLIIGVRGNERLEYRFTAGGPSSVEYSVEEPSSAALKDKLDAWSERIGNVWGPPSAVDVKGAKIWIVPHTYSIRLYTADAGLIVSVVWD